MSGDIQKAYPGPTDPPAPVLRGGPEKCPRTCSECSGEHHFADPMIGFADGDPEHDAAVAGAEVWWECKHCDAWREYTGEEDEESEEEDDGANDDPDDGVDADVLDGEDEP